MSNIYERRSIRKYTDQAVGRTVIEEMIRAGAAAPSAKNRQPWKYLVYEGAAKEEFCNRMQKGLEREQTGKAVLPEAAFGIPDAIHTLAIMREAPALIVVINTNGSSPYEPIDTDRRISEICDSMSIGASIENMLLRAVDLGLGTLWIANTCFAYPELIDYIGTDKQLIGAIAVGYPAERPVARPRKPFEEILEYRE